MCAGCARTMTYSLSAASLFCFSSALCAAAAASAASAPAAAFEPLRAGLLGVGAAGFARLLPPFASMGCLPLFDACPHQGASLRMKHRLNYRLYASSKRSRGKRSKCRLPSREQACCLLCLTAQLLSASSRLQVMHCDTRIPGKRHLLM